MLVLSRKKDERLVINGNIAITVLSIQGSRVRLGIEAPSHVAVQRSELMIDDFDFGDGADLDSDPLLKTDVA